MKDRLFSLLGIEHGEESLMSILLAQSVFLGIFFGAFDISAHSLFLSIFDEKMMARGYVVSGFAGIILTSIYTSLQNRLLFRNFAIINLSFVTTITLFLWLMLLIIPVKGIVFLVFIMLGPLNILAMLGFWGTVSRLFTLRQGKRLFSLVDSGLVIGIILSSYAIPVLLSLNFKAHNILLISTGAALTGTILQFIIGSRFFSGQAKQGKAPEKTQDRKSVLSLVRNNQYIRILGIFIALSVMTAFFVQYSFMAVTREQYPAEEDMARFLGFFIGSMMIFTLLIKLLVFAYLIRNYGLRTCLVLSPLLMVAFTLVAVIIGLLMGFTPATNGFMLFFMLLALSRLFSKSLKDSIESPSFKVIYLTVDEKVRYEVQSGMDGTVNEIAALSSGLILAGLGILSFIRLIHFSIVLIFITGLWVIAALRVYREYRKSIREALETGGSAESGSLSGPAESKHESSFEAEMIFNQNYFSLISGNYSSLEEFKGDHLVNKILDYSETKKDISLLPVLKKIKSLRQENNEISQRASNNIESIELMLSSGELKDDKYFNSQKLLLDTRQPQTTQILRLLRDNSNELKSVGLMLIGKFRVTEMLPEVYECLNIPQLRSQAIDILRTFGKDAFVQLQRYYMVSSGNTEISKTILRLLAEGCVEENQAFIFPRLWSNSRQVKEITAKLMTACDFRSPEGEKDHINQLISDIIGIIVWNLSARICLESNNKTNLLKALNEETARWNTFLFSLLSIAYDSASIKRIRENLESGTVESINYALEMIDIVIDDSIKPKLIPLVDVIPDENKVKSLYQFYPGEIPDYMKLVDDILNRDYNLLGIWIRACAVRDIPEIKDENLAGSVIALLFSPEEILQEESAKLIARSDRSIYKSASQRINAKVRQRLDRILSNETSSEEMLYEKVNFLSACFPGTGEDYLLRLAESMKYIKGSAPGSVINSGGCILLPITPDGAGGNVFIISNPLKAFKDFSGDFYLLQLDAVEKFCNQYPEQSSEVINYIKINEH